MKLWSKNEIEELKSILNLPQQERKKELFSFAEKTNRTMKSIELKSYRLFKKEKFQFRSTLWTDEKKKQFQQLLLATLHLPLGCFLFQQW